MLQSFFGIPSIYINVIIYSQCVCMSVYVHREREKMGGVIDQSSAQKPHTPSLILPLCQAAFFHLPLPLFIGSEACRLAVHSYFPFLGSSLHFPLGINKAMVILVSSLSSLSGEM